MAQWKLESHRKPSGKLLEKRRKKKRYQHGRDYTPTHVGEKKVKKIRTRSAGKKMLALSSNIANVSVKGKAQKTKILGVIENAADAHFVRRNIITKGAVIETELGKARVTSKPGQHGIVNAVLLEEKK